MRRLCIAVIFLIFAVCLSTSWVSAQPESPPYNNPAVDGPERPGYWIDRGALYATYGNYKAAVDAYQKAMELDPSLSMVFYNLGLAYAEMEAFDQALANLNKAIMMSPRNSRYYYARARVLLLSGKQERAGHDFRKAADMGNPDAKAYLER